MPNFLQTSQSIKKLNSNFYAFHAGFCFDPDIKKLGQTFQKSTLLSKELATKNFKKRVLEINRLIKNKNFNLLIENNVITKSNYKKFGCNPLLLTNPKDILNFFINKYIVESRRNCFWLGLESQAPLARTWSPRFELLS